MLGMLQGLGTQDCQQVRSLNWAMPRIFLRGPVNLSASSSPRQAIASSAARASLIILPGESSGAVSMTPGMHHFWPRQVSASNGRDAMPLTFQAAWSYASLGSCCHRRHATLACVLLLLSICGPALRQLTCMLCAGTRSDSTAWACLCGKALIYVHTINAQASASTELHASSTTPMSPCLMTQYHCHNQHFFRKSAG